MVEVVVPHSCREYRVSKKAIGRIVSFIFREERVPEGKISCIFVDDNAIKKLNTAYLGHRFNTDVITFLIEKPPFLEAEIYINVNQARRQARLYKVTVKNEVTRLVIHGVLHALGYDDKRTKQRKKMFELQERYVTRCTRGVPSI